MLVVVIYLVVVTLLDVENLVDAGALVVDFALVVFPWVTDNGSVIVISLLTEEMVIELIPKKIFFFVSVILSSLTIHDRMQCSTYICV